MAFRPLYLRNRKEFSVFTLIYKQNQFFLICVILKTLKSPWPELATWD